MKKVVRNILFISAIIVVVTIIFLVFYFKSSTHLTSEELQFLSTNAVIYTQKTCGHCINQFALLNAELKYHNINEDFQQYFKIFDCSLSQGNMNTCFNNVDPSKNILGTPTWEIHGHKYPGYLTISGLKDLIKKES